MRSSVFLFCCVTFVTLESCSPKITTSLTAKYPPLDYRTEVAVFAPGTQIPADAEVIGMVKIGDTGFSTNCGYDIVVDKAKLEARKAGGNAIWITEHKPPSIMGSSCHRITAKILRTTTAVSQSLAGRENPAQGVNYTILNIYRFSGTGALITYDLYLRDSVICRVSNNFKISVRIKKEGLSSLSAGTGSKSELPVDLKYGNVYYIRCGVTADNNNGTPLIEIVNSETGKAEFESLITRIK